MADELYGWLTLDNKFQECERWNHRQAECIQDLWEELGYANELEEIAQGCQAMADNGDHPEWHCWEMAQYSFKNKVLEAAYAEGLIRVGTRGTDMYFEYGSGSRDGGMMKGGRDAACRALAESKGYKPVFEGVH